MDRHCPEKLYECTECGKNMKRGKFKDHIAKEHQDKMLDRFIKGADEENQLHQPLLGGESESSPAQVVRRIPVGWTRWYMDPPIQWVGVPANLADPENQIMDADVDENQPVVQINFQTLGGIDKFHYIFGMLLFTSRVSIYYIYSFSFWSVNTFFKMMKNGFNAMIQTVQN